MADRFYRERQPLDRALGRFFAAGALFVSAMCVGLFWFATDDPIDRALGFAAIVGWLFVAVGTLAVTERRP